ncbi:hypothetical protein BJX61DRAFT_540622 [Aspergillus egyptiacus]|nr:hypothetical protein BJX61DRAFT_540622 [Aspergillus egyptiacus]
MFFSKLLTVAAALVTASAMPAPAPAPRAVSGGVSIVNNLGQDVYVWSVSATSSPMMVLPVGGWYTEHWQINPTGGGISIKLGTSPDGFNDVLQFEYTKAGDVLFWDLSSIDLRADSPLIAAGFDVKIDDATCPMATCLPGIVDCPDSYQFPDDHNTRACSANAAWTLTLG